VEGHTTFDLLRNSPDMMLKIAMVVIVILCAPITEEFTFRGAMQMGFRGSGFSPWWAIIITSVFFAAVHIPVLAVGAMASGLATLFLLALILGWLMQRTGRIAAPIAAHSLFNLVNLMIFWFG
jgi:membrane protease YdiL (CAAX protease family)